MRVYLAWLLCHKQHGDPILPTFASNPHSVACCRRFKIRRRSLWANVVRFINDEKYGLSLIPMFPDITQNHRAEYLLLNR